MGFVNRTTRGKWKAFWRAPDGKQRSKTFATKRDASVFLAEIEAAKSRGMYVSPHAGRTLFGDHAERCMETWNQEKTTTARDRSLMRNHVMPQWERWQLAKIDDLSGRAWLTKLSKTHSRATVAECKRLASKVMRSAQRNRLIAENPFDGMELPECRVDEHGQQVISQEEFHSKLLPATPPRYRALVAMAGGTGFRWGELAGYCEDALSQAGASVVRTAIEVAGHVEFKPFPKTKLGRRTVPLPDWARTELQRHMETYSRGPRGLIFTNEAGGFLRRTLFRSRVWRPTLVRAGLLGEFFELDSGLYEGVWSDEDGKVHSECFNTEAKAVAHVARHQVGGLRFHDLRHSYSTWLVDDGVPPNMVQRVMGHEHVSTTLQLYTRRTDNPERILEALAHDADRDDGDEAEPPETAPAM